jgi:hypothetical protein
MDWESIKAVLASAKEIVEFCPLLRLSNYPIVTEHILRNHDVHPAGDPEDNRGYAPSEVRRVIVEVNIHVLDLHIEVEV